MNLIINEEIMNTINDYHLPRYREIPNVGLYLDQVVKYLNEYLSLYPDMAVTGSMISNYVKKHLIPNPVKKLYYRDQISFLMFIAIAKTVVSLDNVRLLLNLQQETYDVDIAYDYTCEEFEAALKKVFSRENSTPRITDESLPVKNAEEKFLLHQIMATAAQKVFLEKSFEAARI